MNIIKMELSVLSVDKVLCVETLMLQLESSMPQNMQYVDGRMELSYEDIKCDKMYHFCQRKLKWVPF